MTGRRGKEKLLSPFALRLQHPSEDAATPTGAGNQHAEIVRELPQHSRSTTGRLNADSTSPSTAMTAQSRRSGQSRPAPKFSLGIEPVSDQLDLPMVMTPCETATQAEALAAEPTRGHPSAFVAEVAADHWRRRSSRSRASSARRSWIGRSASSCRHVVV